MRALMEAFCGPATVTRQRLLVLLPIGAKHVTSVSVHDCTTHGSRAGPHVTVPPLCVKPKFVPAI